MSKRKKSLNELDLDEVNAELDRLDAARLEAREQGRILMARRAELVARDNASAHGLTVEEYAAAKAEYADASDGAPFTAVLGRHRKDAGRRLQYAKTLPAGAGIEAQDSK